MLYLNRLLWLLPFAAHLGFAAAVYRHFPSFVGRTVEKQGVPLDHFYAMWVGSVVLANASLLILHLKMPKFKDSMFSVPRKVFWLASKTRRALLIERLRAIVEVSLFGLNVFFLAVFQAIYQVNAAEPIVTLQFPVLFVGFMTVPLLLVVGSFVGIVWSLGRINDKTDVEHT